MIATSTAPARSTAKWAASELGHVRREEGDAVAGPDARAQRARPPAAPPLRRSAGSSSAARRTPRLAARGRRARVRSSRRTGVSGIARDGSALGHRGDYTRGRPSPAALGPVTTRTARGSVLAAGSGSRAERRRSWRPGGPGPPIPSEPDVAPRATAGKRSSRGRAFGRPRGGYGVRAPGSGGAGNCIPAITEKCDDESVLASGRRHLTRRSHGLIQLSPPSRRGRVLRDPGLAPGVVLSAVTHRPGTPSRGGPCGRHARLEDE